MIQQLSERLLKQLQQELEQIAIEVNDPLEKMKSALKPIRQALKKLKDFLTDHPFKDKAEEIKFFKYIKPDFYCWQIYFTELYTIESRIPVGDAEEQVSHFSREFSFIERFFLQYQFHYQYYKLNADELDSLYFIRGVDVQSVLMPQVPELDPHFSTSSDYLFSKMKAYEMLKDWLNERIQYLKRNPNSTYYPGMEEGELYWTGDSINLAEIAVGIHRTKQVNKGTVSVGQIFRWLEEKLHVSMGVPSKRISEIRRRTKFSRTRYLDEMKEETIRSFDKEDEYEPEKTKAGK